MTSTRPDPTEQLAAEQSIAATLSEAARLDDVAEEILQCLGETLHASFGVLWLREADRSALFCRETWARRGLRAQLLDRATRAQSAEGGVGLAGRVWADGKVAWVEDLAATGDERAEMAVALGLASALAFPVFVGDEVLGVIELLGPVPAPPDRQSLELLRAVGSQLGRFLERKRTLEQIRLSETELHQSQKMEAVGQLAGGVAHDFNNVLAVVLGNSRLLMEELAATDPRRELVEEILQACDRATSLTRKLLAFGRRQPRNPEIVNLNEVVGATLEMCHRLADDEVMLDLALSPRALPVLIDRGQLEQVLLELMGNARDAMPDGGILSVRTELVDMRDPERDPGGVPGAEHLRGLYTCLTVSDNGCGMGPGTQARIFEPFFTTKEPGKGTGLGLSTVFGIVQQSGGRIAVESAPGRGSTFRLFFPKGGTTEVAAFQMPFEPAARPGTGTVLVVDDEELVRSMARRILRSSGYEVLEAADGEEALAVLARGDRKIDLVLSDVVMPRLSGPGLLVELRRRHPHLPVLFMSGYTEHARVRATPDLEGQPLVRKPFSPSSLIAKIQELIGR